MGKFIAPHELSLNFKPIFIPNTISQFMGEITKLGNVSEKIYKIDDFISRLETEISKIDAFKRELPLCMLLMNDAIVNLKDELMLCKKSKIQPVVEEFLPMRKPDDDNDPKDESDKKNWLSSTQLWNTIDNDLGTNRISKPKPHEQVIQKTIEEKRYEMIGDSFCGKFIPSKEEISVPGLSLISPGINTLSRGNVFDKQTVAIKNDPVQYTLSNVKSDIQIGNPQSQQTQQQTSRKQRRCWSTELHRRFVNALQQLGGSKVATPKQIRELMNVDGLTNDEVKSHLQKYRLHTKRHPSGPHDQYAEKHPNSQSGSPDGPLMNCATDGTFTTGGDSIIDDGDDDKSEINCWKSKD